MEIATCIEMNISIDARNFCVPSIWNFPLGTWTHFHGRLWFHEHEHEMDMNMNMNMNIIMNMNKNKNKKKKKILTLNLSLNINIFERKLLYWI